MKVDIYNEHEYKTMPLEWRLSHEIIRTCSACNISMGLSEGESLSRFKYCPFCGAKME